MPLICFVERPGIRCISDEDDDKSQQWTAVCDKVAKDQGRKFYDDVRKFKKKGQKRYHVDWMQVTLTDDPSQKILFICYGCYKKNFTQAHMYDFRVGNAILADSVDLTTTNVRKTLLHLLFEVLPERKVGSLKFINTEMFALVRLAIERVKPYLQTLLGLAAEFGLDVQDDADDSLFKIVTIQEQPLVKACR